MILIASGVWFSTLDIECFVMDGGWKHEPMSENEAVEEEFRVLGYSATFKLSEVEDVGLDGRWKFL